MPTTIMPFAGWRYNPQQVPALDRVMTPPYDVISPEERAAYLASDPHSMIHLILGAESESDTPDNNRFTRSGADLQKWKRDGILQREAAPAIYLYQQDFVVHGQSLTRRGFISRVRLEDYEAGVIFPHETTFAGPKADLLQLWQACQANLSQIFSVYLDPARTLETLFEPIYAQPAQVDVAHWGEGRHRLWVLMDPDVIAQVQAAMRDQPLVIADGHHRYETSLALRDVMRQANPDGGEQAPYEHIMMYCANIDDPGVVALPTHRLLQNFPVRHLSALLQGLSDWVEIDTDDRSSQSVEQWQQKLAARLDAYAGTGSPFVVYAGGDRCYMLTVPAAAARDRVTPAEASDTWKQLDVSVLHHAVLPALEALAPDAAPTVAYARAADEVLEAVLHQRCDVAIMMRPTPLEQMVQVAMGGERMPQKSTYFYPKLPTGLVINGFDA